MSTAYITELAMAKSLKKLMLTKPINHIHIQEITDDCRVTRHTFYNHFGDIYELLEWLYEKEVIEDIDQYCNLQSWRQGLMLVMEYTYDNRIICLNTFHSLGRDYLEDFLYRTFLHLLDAIISEIAEDMKVNEEEKRECADFYANALVGVFVSWLKQNLKESPKQMADRIERLLSGNIIHTMNKLNKKYL
ncbi:TetR-like C-terminal domain-containing protein [Anaerosporobacter sp.]